LQEWVKAGIKNDQVLNHKDPYRFAAGCHRKISANKVQIVTPDKKKTRKRVITRRFNA
jgi:hypothetical protein